MLQNYNINTDDTFKIFLENPTKQFYLMEISKEISLAHTSVKRQLDSLVKKGLILKTAEKKGQRKFPIYTSNLQNEEFFMHKKAFNYKQLLLSGIITYLQDSLMPKCIILFGSYAKGEDIENSDIDIYLQCNPEKVELKRFNQILKRKIQLHFNEKFSSYPSELKNNIINGMVVSGYLEVYK